ncbi:enoyl-CoA hydratase, partial [Klebsiella pneumoniae]
AAPAPDAETCLAAALDAARHIASKAPLAIAGTKAALRYARDHAVDDGLNMAALLQASLWNPTDIAASIAARATRTTASHAPLAPIARL